MYNHQLIASVEESTNEATNEIISQDPEIAAEEKKPREEDSPPPYRYVEPEFYNEWYQETQQKTPLDRKKLAICKAVDELKGEDKPDKSEVRVNKWLNHRKRRWLFFGIIPAFGAVIFNTFFSTWGWTCFVLGWVFSDLLAWSHNRPYRL